MIDLYLDPNTHDLVLEDFTFKITRTEQEEITQRVKIKLLMWQGEWFLNENYGIPYRTIFNKGIDLSDIDEYYRVQIKTEDGVQELYKYSSSLDPNTRLLSIKASIKTESGLITNINFAV